MRLLLLLALCGFAIHAASAAEAVPAPATVAPVAAPAALRIAIVPLQGESLPQDVAQIVQDDLARSGRFNLLPRSSQPDQPAAPAEVDFSHWRAQGVDYLLFGQVLKPSDRIVVRFFLMDMVRGVQVLGFDMPAVQPHQLRVLAHQISDLAYARLTGQRGIFNTNLAYVTSTGFGSSRKFALTVADYDGQYPRVVADSREPLLSPAWSPDGRRLALAGFERGVPAVWVHTLATGQLKKVFSSVKNTGAPSFSPDGTRLALTASFDGNPEIALVEIETGNVQRLTDAPGIDAEPSFSPDGKSIAFTSDRDGSPQVYVMPATGGAATRVSFAGRQNYRPQYAPDGKSLAVIQADQGQQYRVTLLDLASGQSTPLGEGPKDGSPSFAPNGEAIIYVDGQTGAMVLKNIRVPGKTTLAPPDSVREVAWSPLYSK